MESLKIKEMTIVIKGLSYNEVIELLSVAGLEEEKDDFYVDDFGLADAPYDNRPMIEISGNTSMEVEDMLYDLWEDVQDDYSEDEVEISFL